MNMKTRPKVGMLLIGAKRFRELGQGTADGAERCDFPVFSLFHQGEEILLTPFLY